MLEVNVLPEVLNEYWKLDKKDKKKQTREKKGTKSVLKARDNLTMP